MIVWQLLAPIRFWPSLKYVECRGGWNNKYFHHLQDLGSCSSSIRSLFTTCSPICFAPAWHVLHSFKRCCCCWQTGSTCAGLWLEGFHTFCFCQSWIPLKHIHYSVHTIRYSKWQKNTYLYYFCLCGSTWLIRIMSIRGTYWPWTSWGQGQAGPSWSRGNGQSHWPCGPLDRRPWHADGRHRRPLSYVQLWRLHPAGKLNIRYVLLLIHN